MRILPVCNYQIQSQNNQKQCLNFGMFQPMNDKNKIFKAIMKLCEQTNNAKSPVGVVFNFRDGVGYTNRQFQLFMHGDYSPDEICVKISWDNIKSLRKLIKDKTSDEISEILQNVLETGRIKIKPSEK